MKSLLIQSVAAILIIFSISLFSLLILGMISSEIFWVGMIFNAVFAFVLIPYFTTNKKE